MYTIDDIQIFVTTHNRASLLKETLQSILAQTVPIKNITVLDNESTDNTAEIVLQLKDRGVHYVHTTGFLGNFKKAQELVSRPYCMLFHDDDLLHPAYLENALKALNSYPNIALITTTHSAFANNSVPQMPKQVSPSHIFFTSPQKWAQYIYFYEGVSYAPAIYKSKALKESSLEYEKFNKFNDWPLLAKMALHGNVVYFIDKHFMYMRQHQGQDSNSLNFPTIQQIVNWDKLFYELMGANNKHLLLHYLYAWHNKHFLFGKLNVGKKLDDKHYTLAALTACCKKENLPTWNFNTKPFKWLFLPFLKHLERSFLSQITNTWPIK